MNFRNSFARLMAVKKLIFDYNNFFCSGHLSIDEIWKKDRNIAIVKLLFSKISFFTAINHVKEFLIFVLTGDVFLQFLARDSYGCLHSYFEKRCLKISTGTPEDMLLTNLGVNCCKSIIGFLLTCRRNFRI